MLSTEKLTGFADEASRDIENSVIGKGAMIGKAARVVDSVVWPGGGVGESLKIDGKVIT